ncbi:MAG TPA: MBL fold metallo-hydrolase [Oligoflexus sp.]|uniref:ComEC/Rec2 family competence protein n=1 Tax=Oligoflexus sp. TaxID=1971216 RepID=UPI002D7FA97C|nr:MBL fold metallo-hydrolase [Oligoflexus sp.]HET9236932.1 MBL fold metallo-hydrolase [Oligoflexus sp.]
MLKTIAHWLIAAGLGTSLPVTAGVTENRPLSPKCSFRSAGPQEDFSRYGLRILSLWVSHGDATLIRLPSGEIALIDSGQDFAVKDYLVPFLQQHGIKELDYFIVTHYHGDHYAGKIEKDGKVYVGYRYDESSPRIPVKNFWDNRTFRRGDEFNWGGTRMFILNSLYTNEWSDDENHRSLSFRLEYNGFTYALGGDIYAQEQDRILNDFPDRVRVHVYRTNHHMHGSASWNYLKMSDPVLFVTSAEQAVYERETYTKILAGVMDQFRSGGARFLENLLTLEKGNILVGANSDGDWSYGCQPTGQYISAFQR